MAGLLNRATYAALPMILCKTTKLTENHYSKATNDPPETLREIKPQGVLVLRHAEKNPLDKQTKNQTFLKAGKEQLVLNDLSPKGISDAQDFGLKLRAACNSASIEKIRIITSPVRRCLDTGNLINDQLNTLSSTIEPKKNIGPKFGTTDLETAMKKYRVLGNNTTSLVKEIIKNPTTDGFRKTGEAAKEVITSILNESDDKTLTVLIAHDFTLMMFLAWAFDYTEKDLETPPTTKPNIFDPDFLATAVFNMDPTTEEITVHYKGFTRTFSIKAPSSFDFLMLSQIL